MLRNDAIYENIRDLAYGFVAVTMAAAVYQGYRDCVDGNPSRFCSMIPHAITALEEFYDAPLYKVAIVHVACVAGFYGLMRFFPNHENQVVDPQGNPTSPRP